MSDKKKIILTAAPGAGKKEVQASIKNKSKNPQIKLIRWFGSPVYYDNDQPALGELADYREELRIAITRVHSANKFVMSKVLKERHVIWTHSLLDSVAYATARLYRMINSGSVSDTEIMRWDQTLHTVTLLLVDSLPDYPILFLRGNDGELFSQDIEEALSIILNDWKIPHLELTSPEDAAKMIEKVVAEDFDIGKVITSGSATASSVSKNDQ